MTSSLQAIADQLTQTYYDKQIRGESVGFCCDSRHWQLMPRISQASIFHLTKDSVVHIVLMDTVRRPSAA